MEDLILCYVQEFWKQLYKLSHREDSKALSNLKFAVFALGSSQYPTFCAFGKNIDKTLQSLGAQPMMAVGMGDELRGQELTFQNWANECYKSSCKGFNLEMAQNGLILNLDDLKYDPKCVRIRVVNVETAEHQIQHELARLH